MRFCMQVIYCCDVVVPISARGRIIAIVHRWLCNTMSDRSTECIVSWYKGALSIVFLTRKHYCVCVCGPFVHWTASAQVSAHWDAAQQKLLCAVVKRFPYNLINAEHSWNESPSSFWLPLLCCGVRSWLHPYRPIVNNKQCETTGLFVSLVIHYCIGDVQDSQGVSASEMTSVVSGGAQLNSAHLLSTDVVERS